MNKFITIILTFITFNSYSNYYDNYWNMESTESTKIKSYRYNSNTYELEYRVKTTKIVPVVPFQSDEYHQKIHITLKVLDPVWEKFIEDKKKCLMNIRFYDSDGFSNLTKTLDLRSLTPVNDKKYVYEFFDNYKEYFNEFKDQEKIKVTGWNLELE